MSDYQAINKIIRESAFHASLSPEGYASLVDVINKAIDHGRQTPYDNPDRRLRVFEQVAFAVLANGDTYDSAFIKKVRDRAELILSESSKFSVGKEGE